MEFGSLKKNNLSTSCISSWKKFYIIVNRISNIQILPNLYLFPAWIILTSNRNLAVTSLTLRKHLTFPPTAMPHILVLFASKTPQRGIYTGHLQFLSHSFWSPLPWGSCPPLCWNCPRQGPRWLTRMLLSPTAYPTVLAGHVLLLSPSSYCWGCQCSVLGLLLFSDSHSLADLLWSLVSTPSTDRQLSCSYLPPRPLSWTSGSWI